MYMTKTVVNIHMTAQHGLIFCQNATTAYMDVMESKLVRFGPITQLNVTETYKPNTHTHKKNIQNNKQNRGSVAKSSCNLPMLPPTFWFDWHHKPPVPSIAVQ